MTWREEARPLRAQKRRERGEGACNIRRVEISWGKKEDVFALQNRAV
jgi:hypothetical protein